MAKAAQRWYSAAWMRSVQPWVFLVLVEHSASARGVWLRLSVRLAVSEEPPVLVVPVRRVVGRTPLPTPWGVSLVQADVERLVAEAASTQPARNHIITPKD
tara:strand:+ start:4196 stop:4498 length:303 start_codon:yes stop_codon:yes gene_type:complete